MIKDRTSLMIVLVWVIGKQIQLLVKPPMYLSDAKLKDLFSTVCIDIHYRKAFAFYVATGCRLKEPFKATISGNWLIITPDVAKSHKTREVELSEQALAVLLEMR